MTPLPAPSPNPVPRPPHRPQPPHRPSSWRVGVFAAAFAVATTLPSGTALSQAGPRDGLDTALAYCTNLSDAAADARFAHKAAKLAELEAQVDARLAALEEKRAEYQEWLQKRERFLGMARESLVSIYSGMRPDAASEQLAAMDELTAAAIVARLAPRTASAVLNEMATEKAARLASIMAGMTQENDRNPRG